MRRPFGQWNCKHTIFPIIMGVSVQALDEATICRYNEMSTQPITIDGKTKTRYEWSQVQRKIETAVREQKDIATVAKASGDRKAERKVRSSVSALMDYYDKISSASKIQLEYGRMAAIAARLRNTSSFRRMSGFGRKARGWGVGESSASNVFASGYKPLTGHDFDANIDVDVPEDVRKLVDKASKRVTDDFPLLDDYLYAIGYGKNEDGNPATAMLSISGGYVGQVIALNRDMWTSAEQMDTFVRDQSARGEHIQAKRADSIITHEYGHALHYSCALKRAGYTGQGTISQQQITRFVVEKEKIAEEIQLLLDNSGLTIEGTRAYEDKTELIAEAISDYYSGKKTKAARAVVEYLKKVFE